MHSRQVSLHRRQGRLLYAREFGVECDLARTPRMDALRGYDDGWVVELASSKRERAGKVGMGGECGEVGLGRCGREGLIGPSDATRIHICHESCHEFQ